jgi:hypothetical protein
MIAIGFEPYPNPNFFVGIEMFNLFFGAAFRENTGGWDFHNLNWHALKWDNIERRGI